MANRRNHFDECSRCICSDCKSVIQCNTCEDCTGEAIEKDAPFAFHKTSCEDFIPENIDVSMDKMCRYFAMTANTNQKMDIKEKHHLARERSNRNHAEYSSFCDKINKKYNAGFDANEFTKCQETRIDEIDNVVFEAIKIMLCNPNMEWDIGIIGPIADIIADDLTKRGYIVYYPALVYDDDNNGTISEFHGI